MTKPNAVLTTLPPTEVDEAEDGDLKLVSVTSILKVTGSDALVFWAADETARAAIADHDLIGLMIGKGDEGIAQAMEHLGKARFRPKPDRMRATDLGTAVHAVLEDCARDIEPDISKMHPQAQPLARHVVDWWAKVQPTPLATELTVFAPDYGYAGSGDLWAMVEGVPVILDLKTSAESHYKSGKERGPYPDQVALQLSAYRFAPLAATWSARRFEKRYSGRFYLLAEDEIAQAIQPPKVDTGVVLHVCPEWARAYPIMCDETVFEKFLHLIEVHRWINNQSKLMMHPFIPDGVTGAGAAALLKASMFPVEPKRKSRAHALPATGVALANAPQPQPQIDRRFF